MPRHPLRLAPVFALAVTLAACGAEPEEPVAATQSDIQAKIFNQNCTLSGCHDATAEGGLDLRAANMRANTIDAPSEKSPLVRIAPGDPDNSFLVIKLENPTGSQGDLMPLGGRRLSEARIQSIRDWIAAGAPE